MGQFGTWERGRPARRLTVLTSQLILDAARLKSRFPISYADAFAVETARQRKAPLVTGDAEILELSKREPIELLWVGAKRPH
ncbi:MAG TPA: PIN domain-containing protein [Terriglobia bacterium]|nr:PIN domain-containing protein [Terriglobia bacterium]